MTGASAGHMRAESFTILDDGKAARAFAAADGDRVLLNPEALREALGWELRPEGLCRGDVCVPFRQDLERIGGESSRGELSGSDLSVRGIDLAAIAAALGRPLALDLEERAAYLGASARDRAAALATLEAPDFTLPDLDGHEHALSAHRGKKILLVFYASW